MDEQPGIKPMHDAEVIDISPLSCPNCRRNVELEDAYCQSCGSSLLETRSRLCGNCGHALAQDSAFCPSCGTQAPSILNPPPIPAETSFTEPTDQIRRVQPPAPPTSADLAPARRSRKKAFAWTGAIILLLAAAGAGWYFFLRPPDLTIYDSEMKSAVALAEGVQGSLDDLQSPGDLPVFADSIAEKKADLAAIGETGRSLDDEEHRLVLVDVIETQDSLLVEMERLASLPSASIDESEFSSLPDLVADFESSYAAALRLRPIAGLPSEVDLEHRILERTLYDLADYRKEVIAERARITRVNKQQARELASTEAFIGALDGIISRYADSRTELSDWIEETNAGATFFEAYQTLDQQQARRVELRDELAALESPAAFSGTKTELLSIMDTAIDAMGAASRGMTEYQFDWSYWDFRDTPGWQQFESATSDITNRFSATLSDYETTKESVLKKLSKKKPLPELPE